jgi:hypothetical protein
MFADEIDATGSPENSAIAPETFFELRWETLCRHKKSILPGLSKMRRWIFHLGTTTPALATAVDRAVT